MGTNILIRNQAEKDDLKDVTYAKHRKPNMPIVKVEGKKYRDVTDAFTSSEWEGARNYEIQSIQK